MKESGDTDAGSLPGAAMLPYRLAQLFNFAAFPPPPLPEPTSTTSSTIGDELLSPLPSRTTQSNYGRSSTTSPTNGGSPSGNNRDKLFQCGVCNRSFGYKHVLQNHERTHTGEKPFECKECHKRFTRDHHLKTHMRLHTGEKPYHCTHCERQFVQVANLRRHLRVHTGERPYACELCTSRFSDSNQLKAHMLIHKGEKPFTCNLCMGRFRRRHHLMHHKCPKDPNGQSVVSTNDLGSPPSPDDGSPVISAKSPLLNFDASPTSLQISQLLRNSEISATSELLRQFQSPLPLALPPTPSSPTLPSLLPIPAHIQILQAQAAQARIQAQSMVSGEKVNRRKPKHTVRILSEEQQRELYLGPESEQTEPLDMSAKKSFAGITELKDDHKKDSDKLPSSTGIDGVLDLSSSRSSSLRSDSEVDAASSTAGPFPDDDQGSMTPDEEFHDDLDDDDVEHMESEGSEGDLSLRKSLTPINPLSSSNGRNKLEVS